PRRPPELSACVRIFEQVASALDYAHRRGVAHGALTPGSIIVDANEWALVDDFAMRALLDIAPDGAAGDPAAQAGEDQRALAAIAYECLTGTPLGDSLPTAEDDLPELPLHVSQALRRAVSSRQADRFPSVLDFVAALGGTRPDVRTAWVGGNPPKKGPGTPVVLVDADWDPAAKPLGGRLAAAAAGLLVALGGVAAWLGISSIPASPASREPVASAPARATGAPPMAPSASRDTFLPPARDAAPRSSATPAPVRPKRPSGTTRAPLVRRPARDLEPGFLSVNAIPWGSVYLGPGRRANSGDGGCRPIRPCSTTRRRRFWSRAWDATQPQGSRTHCGRGCSRISRRRSCSGDGATPPLPRSAGSSCSTRGIG